MRDLFISYDFPIGVCFIDDRSMHFHSKKKKTKKKRQKKKQKQKKNKKNNKMKKNKTKMKQKKRKRKKKECKDMFVSHILLHRFFVVGFIIGGLSEIFMRDELRESSLRSFVPCSSND